MSLITIGSVLFGGLITWFVAKVYYAKAAKDLKEEAAELRCLMNLTIKALDNSGLVQFVRNEKNQITGIVVEGRTKLNRNHKKSGLH